MSYIMNLANQVPLLIISLLCTIILCIFAWLIGNNIPSKIYSRSTMRKLFKALPIEIPKRTFAFAFQKEKRNISIKKVFFARTHNKNILFLCDLFQPINACTKTIVLLSVIHGEYFFQFIPFSTLPLEIANFWLSDLQSREMLTLQKHLRQES